MMGLFMKRRGYPLAMMRHMRHPMMVVTTAPRRPVLMNAWKPEVVSKLVRPAAMSVWPGIFIKLVAQGRKGSKRGTTHMCEQQVADTHV